MLIRARFGLVLLAFLVAACGTTRRQNTAGVPDWEDPGATPTPSIAMPAVPAVAPKSPGPVSNGNFARVAAPGETWVSLQRWLRVNSSLSLTRLNSTPVPTFLLHSSQGALTFSPGSQSARWDGVEFRLGFAPQLIDDQPFLHSLDLRTSVQPLLEGRPGLELGASPVIVIDPGHGGENSGTHSVVDNRYEKEYTLDWARRLQALMAAQGWRAYLTRSNDSDLALSNRVAFAIDHHADVFLSLHFNSAFPDEGEAGLETYCLTPAGMPSTLTRGFADEITEVFPNNAFDAQNLELAVRVHRSLLEVNHHQDRGVRHARFPGVLRGQRCPAILVEGGYLSNPAEARRIGEAGYRAKLAEAVAGALARARMPQIANGSPSGATVRLESDVVRPAPTSEPSAIQR